MLDLDEITRKAQEAPRQTTDVEVIFDAGLSGRLDELKTERRDLTERVEQIDADLAVQLENLERDRRASDPRPAAARKTAEKTAKPLRERLEAVSAEVDVVQAEAAESLVTFRFTALHGYEWDELTARSTPRSDAVEDGTAGYNTDEVSKIAAARCGARLAPDGTLIPISAEQWATIWRVAPAQGLKEIRSSLWYLHHWLHKQERDEAVAAARKGSTVREDETRTSRSTSASTRDVSEGGNPPKPPTTSTTIKAA